MFIIEDEHKKLFIREVEFTDNSVGELSLIYGGLLEEHFYFLNIFKDLPDLIINNINGDFEPLCDADDENSSVFESYNHVIRYFQAIMSKGSRFIIEDIRGKKSGKVLLVYYNINKTTIYPKLNTYLRKSIIDKLLDTL